MDIVADGKTVVMTLRHFSKRFADGKGGLSHDERARATKLGSDARALPPTCIPAAYYERRN